MSRYSRAAIAGGTKPSFDAVQNRPTWGFPVADVDGRLEGMTGATHQRYWNANRFNALKWVHHWIEGVRTNTETD